jgi:hypothetical protein
MGKGDSSSAQKAEGDIVFNNVDYGGGTGQSGAGALKNFNVGRENTLSENVFNLTDGGSTRAALEANTAVAGGALGANAMVAGAAFQSNERTSARAMQAVQQSAGEAMRVSGKVASRAIDSSADLSKFTTGKVIDLSLNALGTYEDLVTRTGQQVTDAQVVSAQASGKALDYVFESSKTSTERQSENLIKYATYGGVAIISAVALTAMVKR